MHFLEFVALNLRSGQKVHLHYKTWNGHDTVKIDCFYLGLKHNRAPSSTVIHSADELQPVFTLPNKDGRAGRKHVEPYILFSDIISIEPFLIGPEQSIILPKDIQGYMQGADTPAKVAIYQIQSIAEEMAELFDGKAIQLCEPLAVASVFETHGGITTGFPVYIVSVSYDREALHLDFDVVAECYNKRLSCDGLCINDPVYLLSELMASIRCPSYEEHAESCVDLRSLNWKDIPDCDPERTPVLAHTGILSELRSDKWFDSLTDKEKEEAFQLGEAQIIRAFLARNHFKPESFVKAVNHYWNELGANEKYLFFSSKQKRDAA